MQNNKLIAQILDLEWPMFHGVNGEDRVDCQENESVFRAMRSAMYTAWDTATLESYRQDLERARDQGRNVAREKYIRMMASSDPAGFACFSAELPPDSPAKQALVDEIWRHMYVQTLKLRSQYPALALSGRPLPTKEDDLGTSVESYQRGELMTYSEQTLSLYLENLLSLENQGVDLAAVIQENTVRNAGYESLEDAERQCRLALIYAENEAEGPACCIDR